MMASILDLLGAAGGAPSPDALAYLSKLGQQQRTGIENQMGALDLMNAQKENRYSDELAKVLASPNAGAYANPYAGMPGMGAPAPQSPAPGQASVPMTQPGQPGPQAASAPAMPVPQNLQLSPQAQAAASAPSAAPGGAPQKPEFIDLINQVMPDASPEEKGQVLMRFVKYFNPEAKMQMQMWQNMIKAQQGQQNIDIRKDTQTERARHDVANEGLGQQRVDATNSRTGAVLQAANIRAATAAANQQLQRDLAAGRISQQKYNTKVNALGKIASDYSRQATAFGANADDIAEARKGFETTKAKLAEVIGDEPVAPETISTSPSVNTSAYKSAADVQAAYKAGKIDYDTAAKALKDNGWAQ